MSKFLIKFALALKKLRVRVKAAAQHWPSELATLHSPCTSLAVLFRREDRSAQAGGSEGLQREYLKSKFN